MPDRIIPTVLLALNGYAVVGAADGVEALALLLDGLRPAAIPTVAVSAAVRGENLQRALQVDTFLPKPLDVDKLLALAARHCRPDPEPPA